MKYRTPTTVSINVSVIEGQELKIWTEIGGYAMKVSPTERGDDVYDKVQAYMKSEAEKQARWPTHAWARVMCISIHRDRP